MPNNLQKDRKKRYTDEQTDKRIHEHLVNEDDAISEADIENVKTDETITHANNRGENVPLTEAEEAEKEEAEKAAEQQEEKVIKNNSNPGIQTSWNILDE